MTKIYWVSVLAVLMLGAAAVLIFVDRGAAEVAALVGIGLSVLALKEQE